MQAIAKIKNLGKSYANRVIFRDINMTVKPYEPIVIMGQNGCGKSTLLKIIAGVLAGTEGEVQYRPKIKISFVPDRFPKLNFSVENYLMYMGKIQGVSESDINSYIEEYFSRLNMPQDFRKTKISKCSKGTIQKVNILQTLITKPDLLILDEPFAGLDEDSEEGFILLLHKLISDGVAIVIACHEKKLARRITDNIYIFANQSCHISNGFIEQYLIRFLDNGEIFKPDDLFVQYNMSPEGYYETLIEKRNLREALGRLIAQGYEIYSVNPKYGKAFGDSHLISEPHPDTELPIHASKEGEH